MEAVDGSMINYNSVTEEDLETIARLEQEFEEKLVGGLTICPIAFVMDGNQRCVNCTETAVLINGVWCCPQ